MIFYYVYLVCMSYKKMPTGWIEQPTSPLRVARSTTELNGLLKITRYCDYSIVLPLFFPLKKSNIIYVYSRRWRHPFKFITRSLGTYSSYCHGSVVLPRKQGFPTHVYQPTERTNDIIRSYPLTHDPHHSVELASSSPPSFSLSLNLVHYKALCSRSVAPKSTKK